jgi:hypothetical protein
MSQHMTWQQRLRNDISIPFLCFFVLQAAFLLFCVLHPVAEIGMVDTIHQIGSWFILSWWICHDAAQCKFVLPMSYGFLILFAAPIYAPIYMFQTRGWMALQTLGLFIGTYAVLWMIYFIVTAQMMLAEL